MLRGWVGNMGGGDKEFILTDSSILLGGVVTLGALRASPHAACLSELSSVTFCQLNMRIRWGWERRVR